MPSPTIEIILLTSFAIGFSGAISPGPLLTYTITESLKKGFIAGPLITLGHALIELVLVIILTLGINIFTYSDKIFAIIGAIGGLYLAWMAYGMLIKSPVFDLATRKSESNLKQFGNQIFGGILLSITNPFWGIWWTTIGLSYLIWARNTGVLGIASFYTGHIMSDFLWYGLVSFGIGSGRHLISPQIYKGLMLICGLFVLGLAFYFIFSALNILLFNNSA